MASPNIPSYFSELTPRADMQSKLHILIVRGFIPSYCSQKSHFLPVFKDCLPPVSPF